MALAVYDEKELLSIPYCVRKIRKLEHRQGVLISGGFAYLHDEELKSIYDHISFYRNIINELERDLRGLSEDELLKFIVDEMIPRIQNSHVTKIKISFSHVDDYLYTVKISIYNVFSTEVSFKHELFQKNWEYNEHYDGYHDLCEYVYTTSATDFMKGIVSKFEKMLKDKLPEVEIKCYCA